MLRTFVECEDVAAVINVTCCYHLLTEATSNELPGFPLSETVDRLGLALGRSARELACESADRWKEHHPTKAAQSFELHAFRAAFQLILDRHYPEFATSRPSVGRVGKSRRRRKARQSAMEPLMDNTGNDPPDVGFASPLRASTFSRAWGPSSQGNNGDITTLEKQVGRFEEYVRPVLELVSLPQLPTSVLTSIWTEVAPHQDLVGPFYSLRTVMAPVVESYILLDRLLYLKEQGARITAHLVPIFQPATSPRNMAIIAHRRAF